MIDKSTQEWFTTTGAARYIGASKDTIRALTISKALMPYYRRGSKRRWYKRSELDALHKPALMSMPLQLNQ